MIKTVIQDGVLTIDMNGPLSLVGAELTGVLYEFQRRARQELGKEQGDEMTRDIVSVIRPGSEMRKMAKKAKGEK